MKVGFDVDGVLMDAETPACEALGYPVGALRTWDWDDSFGGGALQRFLSWFNKPESHDEIGPMEGDVQDALYRLEAHGTDIVYITRVAGTVSSARMDSVASYFPAGPVYIVDSMEEKAELAVALGVTHFIEDHPQTAIEMAAAGIRSSLVPSGYALENHTPGELLDAGVHLQTVPEFVDEILEGCCGG